MQRLKALTVSAFAAGLLLSIFTPQQLAYAEVAAKTEAVKTDATKKKVEKKPPTVEERLAAIEKSGASNSGNLDAIWTLLAAFLVFFMQAGFALVETGFTRAKNACNIIMKNLMDFSLGSLLFWLVGFGLMFGVTESGWIGTSFFMFDAHAEDVVSIGNTESFNWAFLLFQTVFCATAATIVSGAMAERTKFTGYLIYSVAITAIVYPIFGKWAWGSLLASDAAEGWLQKLGFLDFAGSTVVHSVGGWCALAGAIVIGPRIGKFKNGKPVPIPGHNLPLAALGVFILWLGWFGFNPGSTTAIRADRVAADGGATFAYIAMTTNLAAAAGAVTAMLTAWLKFKKPDTSFALNGALAGLVAITAGCDVMTPFLAILTGGIGGVIVVFSVLLLDKLKIDDPVGAVSVHGVCGAWGTLAIGLFPALGMSLAFGAEGSLITQATGVLAAFAWAFPVSFGIFYAIKMTVGLRVSEQEEIEGLDMHEHGMLAYPAGFVSDIPTGGGSAGITPGYSGAVAPAPKGWYGRATQGASPYRLYALSNIGSLLALVSYPFVFEPALSTTDQARFWTWGFAVFAVFCAISGVLMCRVAQPGSALVDEPREVPNEFSTPTWGRRFLWFGLSMVASVMLLATTNQVCMDVAAVPFLWVLPLTLYLMSFILCFDSDRWYSRRTFSLALAVSIAGVCVVMLKGAGGSIVAQVLVYMAGLFFSAMVCHGELVRLKPGLKFLTEFYLVIAGGGAAGGVFVGIIAPLVFPAYLELHVALFGCCVLILLVFFGDKNWVLHAGRPRWAWGVILLGVFGLTAALRVQAGATLNDAVDISRNFYGVLKVREVDIDDPAMHRVELYHGRIKHGQQFTSPEKRRTPTTYYGRQSGVGLILGHPRDTRAWRVGVVGLGVGTLAVYARPGDHFRFYEINPDVTRLAKSHFSYLKDCQGKFDVETGDARLLLEREQKQQFDVLVLDAFSGDAIPAHLLTAEAMNVYLRHLNKDGVLAIHISNLHFDLRPVVAASADKFGLHTVAVKSQGNRSEGTETSMWMLLSRNASTLDRKELNENSTPLGERRILWTDNKSNLFEILR
eukprot:g26663.t1